MTIRATGVPSGPMMSIGVNILRALGNIFKNGFVKTGVALSFGLFCALCVRDDSGGVCDGCEDGDVVAKPFLKDFRMLAATRVGCCARAPVLWWE